MHTGKPVSQHPTIMVILPDVVYFVGLWRYALRNNQFLFVLAACLSWGIAFASDPVRIENSTNDLVAEVKDALDAGFLTSSYSQYIPGYGLHLFVEKSRSLPQLDVSIDEISSALLKNNEDVLGLPDSEWLSVFFRASGEYDLIIRMRQGDPSSLEVWVDGELEQE